MAVVMIMGTIPMTVFAESRPFTAITTDKGDVLGIEDKGTVDYTGYSTYKGVPYYHVTIPEGATKVYVTHPASEDPFADANYGKAYGYVAETEGWTGSGTNFEFESAEDGYIITLPLSVMVDTDSDWIEDTEGSFVADEEGYVGYAVAVERNDYSPICFFTFEYGMAAEEPEVPAAPFLSIAIGGNQITDSNIEYKGIFHLGDYDEDEQQEDTDSYDYVHEVPYYHITVPCGTEYADITYNAETNIMNNGSDAYGYRTVINTTFDAATSATVKGTTFKTGYTKNADGTQIVKTPVKNNTVDADGNGYAITLEENDSPFAAICLFSFKYDGINHVYDDGKVTTEPTCTEAGVKTFTCTCGDSYTEETDALGHDYKEGVCENCGEKDPDFTVPGVEIPAGAPFTAITTDDGEVAKIEGKGNVDYTGYSTYEGVPYYHVTIPAGATKVYVTHPASEDPFADANYGSAYGYVAETEGWTGSGTSFEFESAEDGYIIILPLNVMVDTDGDWTADTEGSFVADEEGYVGYAVAVERNDYSPICFFTFEFAVAEEGEHVHSYDEGVITTEPTCTEKGVKTFTCGGCTEGTEGHSYTEDVAALGHDYDEGVVTTKSTCVTDGVKTYTCQNDASHTKTESIAKTGHNYNDGEITIKPTCTEEGVKTYTCQNEGCEVETEGHTKTEFIPMIDHTYGDDRTCDVCGFVDASPEKDKNGVYQIGTAEELLWFAEAVNGGNTGISAVLTADIDLSEVENWPGVGIYGKAFAGDFDGQNHVVTFNNSTWGLFGYTMGTHKDHNLKDAVTIQNVIIDGTVKNSALIQNAGYTHVFNCINRADITGGNSNVAGIVGTVSGSKKYGQTYSNIKIQNCANEGDIKGGNNTGGILGYTSANTHLDGCYNIGTISGSEQVGGIVGYMQGSTGASSIKNSYNLGAVSGTSRVAGLAGTLYNGASVANCYNAGKADYAIAGFIYNNKVNINDTYYRGDLCTYSVPNLIGDNTKGFYGNGRGVAKTSAEMSGEEIVTLLGESFKQSCPSPVLTYQDSCEHRIENNICVICKQGNNMPTEYAVTVVLAEGVTVDGDTAFRAGCDAYTFTVNVIDGYYKTDDFAVYVDNTEVQAVDDVYTVEQPNGPFYITVKGVKKLEGVLPIALPPEGYGYRVNPCDGYSTTVESGKDYKFTVSFVDGFKAGENFTVKVNGEAVKPDETGIYSIENVLVKQAITVEGVDIIPFDDTVTIHLAITRGGYEFLMSEKTDEIMMDKQIEIPYFDIQLYGLEKYYYNPYCYVDENGNINGQQKAGNRESAYGVVTSMHAFIYMTEVYYLGYDPEDAGSGHSDTVDTDKDGVSDFDEAVFWTQNAGSSFMDLWGLGTNLNYHLNYEYPTAYEGWGSTSDQQKLEDGDLLSVHMITGSASGSGFGLFVVDDDNGSYDRTDVRDSATVKQGTTIKLTHYMAVQGEKYTTAFVSVPDKDLYWVEEGDETSDIREWNRDGFGTMEADVFKTDANGVITIDTTGLEPGTYYIGTAGGFAKGNGTAGSDGFVSNGSEAGPAYFKLVVEASGIDDNNKVVYGDVNGDGEIDIKDSNLIVSYFYENATFTEAQKEAADVNGDGKIDIKDANLIVSFFYENMESFPVK